MTKPAWIAVAIALLALGCGGGTPDTPTAGNTGDANTSAVGSCRFSIPIEAVRQTTGAAANDMTIAVTSVNGCAWTAVSQSDFITITQGASGSLSANVTLHVAENGGAQRQGQVIVAGITVTITQQAAACAFALSGDTGRTFGREGGSGSVTLTVTRGVNCSWSASSSSAFVRITSATTGVGSATVTFAVDANSGGARSAILTIAGQAVTLNQEAALAPQGCLFSVVPTAVTIGFAGGSTTLVVTDDGGPACSWNVTSSAPFLTIGAISHTSDTRSEVIVTTAANGGAARTGTVTLSNSRTTAVVTFTQENGAAGSACAFSVAPTTVSVGVSGGAITLVVLDDGGPTCSWNVSSNAPFITVGAITHTSDTRSEVTLNAASNSGAARTGSVSITNPRMSVTVSVSQAGS